ncbi:MAG: NADH-quinone oxidoreductase subunit L, partial [Armatimonadota bacterium]|nr:NADH-quinone oxidoreductase subunit L [Armatimonadota bacterium]
FLVARMYPVFVGPAATEPGGTSVALMVVAGVGAFTVVFAATMGMPSMDIKKVLAYSTISQLGYMYIGLGCFGYTVALFHLMTHAFFKALLFLGAGSVHHATHTYDMREMGGLRAKMPITRFTFLMGCLALAGMIPFSGFWSKDAILGTAFLAHGWYYKLIFLMGLFGALLTAFYTFRMYCMVFEGEARDHHIYDHAHESPRAMTLPLQILAVGAIFIGFVGIPFAGANLFGKLAEYSYKLRQGLSAEETAGLTAILMIVSLAVVTVGIWLAVNTYLKRRFRTPEEGGLRGVGLQPAYVAASHLWYMNEFYTDLLVQPLMTISAMIGDLDNLIIDGILVNGPAWLAVRFARINDWIDRNIVDGLVRVVAGFSEELGLMFRNVQQGVVQVYALIVFVSVFCLVIVMHFLR